VESSRSRAASFPDTPADVVERESISTGLGRYRTVAIEVTASNPEDVEAVQASLYLSVTLREGRTLGSFEASGKSSGGSDFAGTASQALDTATEQFAAVIGEHR
jgi:hypothetical protein